MSRYTYNEYIGGPKLVFKLRESMDNNLFTSWLSRMLFLQNFLVKLTLYLRFNYEKRLNNLHPIEAKVTNIID